MQRYKVRVCNGDYSLSAVYDTIAEVYKCLCAVMSWARWNDILPGRVYRKLTKNGSKSEKKGGTPHETI